MALFLNSDIRRQELLALPKAPVKAVLDTDTYNEIDDQFALVYALLTDAIDLQAVYAAPFHNERSAGPSDGMEKSYAEILRILDMLGVPTDMAFKGSESYLPAKGEPVDSPAARDLIQKALVATESLYVLTIGAPTNVASAILMEPAICEKIVVVWLGGQPTYWPTAREFNLMQDIPASQVLFDSGVPLVQIPCKNVAEHLRTTLPEMAAYVRGHGAIGDYLYQIYEDFADDHYARSKVIWDISTVAWIINPDWVPTELMPSPILRDDLTWDADAGRHLVRMATDVHRDQVYRDLFQLLP